MASPLSDDDVFERLKKTAAPESIAEREKAVREKLRAQHEAFQRRLSQLVAENSTHPVSIASIRVNGTRQTRRGFLQKLIEPALAADKQSNYTLESAMDELQRTTARMNRMGIFRSVQMFIDQLPLTADGRVPLKVDIEAREASRFTLKTGTDLGSNEGSGYVQGIVRNVFGGAESIQGSASVGTRTRIAYDATASAPLAANPDLILDIGGYGHTRQNYHYASHEEGLYGGRLGLRYLTSSGEHEINYSGVMRQITKLAEGASATVRKDAGDSWKSSITHAFVRDLRDNKLLPTRGTLLKASTELAGSGLGGDVSYLKNELETQTAFSLPAGISASLGGRAGLLYPLGNDISRLNDRFQLGGPTDMRGFREGGVGPRDGADAVGGDVYVAAGANVLFPLPRVGRDKPVRFQAFVNSGRLIGEWKGAVERLGDGLPSTAAGVGLVYAHPLARFELNFCFPLVVRAGERGRKGLQFGVGINFL